MVTSFIMPKFDMDQESAKIVSWTKKEGDKIALDETVLVVETDKVAIDVPAPAAGVLAGIKYQEGDEVPVTSVIAYILDEGESLDDIEPEEGADKPTDAPINGAAKPSPKPEKRITPVAKRMAEAHGVDVDQIPASGKKITKENVQAYLKSNTGLSRRVAVSATPAARRLASELSVNLAAVEGSGPQGRVQADDVIAASTVQSEPAAQAVELDRAYTVVPLEGMRSTIADRMQTSFQTAPHISLSIEVDVTNIEKLRTRLNQLASDAGGSRVTMTALLVKVVAWALSRNPYLNASLDDDQIKLWSEVNVGVAVALKEGLIVPVVRNADHKPVSEINSEIKTLAEKAKSNTLGLSDIRGGTFTISNLGMFGIRQFRAIINLPESAILAVGEVVRKPVVVNELDEVEVRPMMTITLSADHRIVDGAVAAYFLKDLTMGIESPDVLIY